MHNRKVALITEQDGSYLAEFLLNKGYEVHGIKRRTSLFNTDRIDHLYQDPHEKNRHFFLHHGDMTDSSSHVIPALIRKFHEAKERGDKEVVVWGTGMPRREFLYSDDMADACVFLMNLPDDKFIQLLWPAGSPRESVNSGLAPFINIGAGNDLTIRELAEYVCEVVSYSGAIVFDKSKPDGTPRKLLARLSTLGWGAGLNLKERLKQTYQIMQDSNLSHDSRLIDAAKLCDSGH